MTVVFGTAVLCTLMAQGTGIKTLWQIHVADTRGSHISITKIRTLQQLSKLLARSSDYSLDWPLQLYGDISDCSCLESETVHSGRIIRIFCRNLTPSFSAHKTVLWRRIGATALLRNRDFSLPDYTVSHLTRQRYSFPLLQSLQNFTKRMQPRGIPFFKLYSEDIGRGHRVCL
jgi:hypothetical protein